MSIIAIFSCSFTVNASAAKPVCPACRQAGDRQAISLVDFRLRLPRPDKLTGLAMTVLVLKFKSV